MKTFSLTVECVGAAFEDDPDELTRILRVVTNKVSCGGESGVCWDINGNNAGRWILEEA